MAANEREREPRKLTQRDTPIEWRVGSNAPFSDLGQSDEQLLAVDDIRPVVRIAHRLPGVLNVPERIIFDHELVLILKGNGVLSTNKTRYEFAAHHIFLIPPFLPHAFSSPHSCEHIAVHFDLAPGVPHFPDHPELRRPYRITLGHGLALPFHRVLSPSDSIEAILLELIRYWQLRSPTARLGVQACLQRVLVAMLGQPERNMAPLPDSDGGRQRARIERSIAYINMHFTEAISSSDIAKSSGLSASRFSQVFRQWTGHSPKEYLRRVRIDKARALLADIDLSVKEVAARTGFEDQYHFSRIFRQIDGLSPTLYREALLAGRRAP
jgi:AraC-like DNA-binding protein